MTATEEALDLSQYVPWILPESERIVVPFQVLAGGAVRELLRGRTDTIQDYDLFYSDKNMYISAVAKLMVCFRCVNTCALSWDVGGTKYELLRSCWENCHRPSRDRYGRHIPRYDLILLNVPDRDGILNFIRTTFDFTCNCCWLLEEDRKTAFMQKDHHNLLQRGTLELNCIDMPLPKLMDRALQFHKRGFSIGGSVIQRAMFEIERWFGASFDQNEAKQWAESRWFEARHGYYQVSYKARKERLFRGLFSMVTPETLPILFFTRCQELLDAAKDHNNRLERRASRKALWPFWKRRNRKD